tara:strand:+ start:49 stop:735 length:687 start_codon:yes stop_codon:yes gene_type:complete
MKAHTKETKSTNNTDSKVNMAPINKARTKLSTAWSGDVRALGNTDAALKAYAAGLDDNGLGIVAIVNADKTKSKWETFQKRYGDLFPRELWESAHIELAKLKKIYLKHYSSKGSQTFEAWLQNFKLKLMLVQGKKEPTKEAKNRRKDKRKLVNAVTKAYKDSRPAKKEESATDKIYKNAKSITVNLNQVVELLGDIRELDNDAGKKNVDKILASIETLLTSVSAMESK